MIGGAFAVEGFGSAMCGSCWELTYGSTTIHVLAIDHAQEGFNIALGAMDKLTGGQAQQLGRVMAQAKQVTPIACGLNPKLL